MFKERASRVPESEALIQLGILPRIEDCGSGIREQILVYPWRESGVDALGPSGVTRELKIMWQYGLHVHGMNLKSRASPIDKSGCSILPLVLRPNSDVLVRIAIVYHSPGL